MKFGEAFMEYLHADQEKILEKCSHVEYKRLKKVLKGCRTGTVSSATEKRQLDIHSSLIRSCKLEDCNLCSQKFFTELMQEASDITIFFRSRVRRLLHVHTSSGISRYIQLVLHCLRNDRELLGRQSRKLTEYVTMNAIAMRKILKKYDKVHCSVSGRNFKMKLQKEHLELLQPPWILELGALYLNFSEEDDCDDDCNTGPFTCSFDDDERPVMTLVLPDSKRVDYDLTCAICLEIVYNPHALQCGHIFCRACACSAASLMIFEDLKLAGPLAKCPVCREMKVYNSVVRMSEVNMLVKGRCKDYWKERRAAEHVEMLRQSREYWDLQTRYALGY